MNGSPIAASVVAIAQLKTRINWTSGEKAQWLEQLIPCGKPSFSTINRFCCENDLPEACEKRCVAFLAIFDARLIVS